MQCHWLQLFTIDENHRESRHYWQWISCIFLWSTWTYLLSQDTNADAGLTQSDIANVNPIRRDFLHEPLMEGLALPYPLFFGVCTQPPLLNYWSLQSVKKNVLSLFHCCFYEDCHRRIVSTDHAPAASVAYYAALGTDVDMTIIKWPQPCFWAAPSEVVETNQTTHTNMLRKC